MDGLVLTAYLGERDRDGDRFLADALLDACERHAIRASVLLRGAEGFGIKHQLRTDRLLTLSEDLPVVVVAVDHAERIAALAVDVEALLGDGLLTLERVRLLDGGERIDPSGAPRAAAAGAVDAAGADMAETGETKLTVYLGRHERLNGQPAARAVVALLHRHGVAGASVLLGVDGTIAGERRRASFVGRNADVPVMVVAVGDAGPIAAAVAELRTLLADPLLTAERVRVCKRDGERLARPPRIAGHDAAGLARWQRLTVYASEQARHGGQPQHIALIRRLRRERARGATVLRGVWGYHGAHAPHGDRFWALRRRVPVVTTIIDDPDRARRWFEIADELTGEAGLVTSETVPALQATGPQALRYGGLQLAAADAGR